MCALLVIVCEWTGMTFQKLKVHTFSY